jgi:uncharacterized membrane protein
MGDAPDPPSVDPPTPPSVPVRWTRSLFDRLGRLSLAVWILLGFVAVYVEVLSAYCYLRFPTFFTNAWDMGIFQQSIWSTGAHGRLFYYTAELSWNSSGSLLGVHWSPILFLLVPFYAALPGPLTLIVIQATVVGASAFPLFSIVRRRSNEAVALALCVFYLLSPPIVGALLYDFHVESFIPLTALTLIAAWEAKRYRLATLAAALLLCTIEFAPLIFGAIGLEFLLRRTYKLWNTTSGRERLGQILQEAWVPGLIVLASVPLAILWFNFPKLISPYTPGIGQLGPLGGSVLGVLEDLVLRPGLFWTSLTSIGNHKLHYLWALLLSGGVVWPLAPFDFLPAVPWMLVVLVGSDPSYATPVGNQYAFLTVPFLFPATATVIGWLLHHGDLLRQLAARLRRSPRPRPAAADAHPGPSRWRRPLPRWAARIGAPTLVIVLALAIVAVPTQAMLSPFAPHNNYSWLGTGQTPTAQDRVLEEILGMIPAGASVSAEPDLFPQVADRLNAYPYYQPGTQYLVVNIQSFWFTSPMPPPDPPMVWYDELRQNVSGEYGVLASGDGGLLYERGYTGAPQFLIPDTTDIYPEDVTNLNTTFVPNSTAPFGAYLAPNQTLRDTALWTGPNFLVPPGRYTANIYLRNNGTATGGLQLTVEIDHGHLVVSKTILGSDLPGNGWQAVTVNVTVAHPAYLSINGTALGVPPSIEFGGAAFYQEDATSILG